MKKQMMAVGVIVFGSLVLGQSVLADGTYNSNAKVTFKQDTGKTNPTDPLNPGTDVTPENPDGTNPNEGTNGPLSIDFASSFGFGDQFIVSTDKEYNAKAQSIGNDTYRPNYLQVTDKRGGEMGWTVQVKQANQFTSTSGRLDGAVLSFSNGEAVSASSSAIPSFVQKKFSLAFADQTSESASQRVMGAKVGEGAGTWVYRFGDDVTKDSSVKLAVPGRVTKYVEEYTSNLVWTLADTPDDTPVAP